MTNESASRVVLTCISKARVTHSSRTRKRLDFPTLDPKEEKPTISVTIRDAVHRVQSTSNLHGSVRYANATCLSLSPYLPSILPDWDAKSSCFTSNNLLEKLFLRSQRGCLNLCGLCSQILLEKAEWNSIMFFRIVFSSLKDERCQTQGYLLAEVGCFSNQNSQV